MEDEKCPEMTEGISNIREVIQNIKFTKNKGGNTKIKHLREVIKKSGFRKKGSFVINLL